LITLLLPSLPTSSYLHLPQPKRRGNVIVVAMTAKLTLATYREVQEKLHEI